jgi:hypothetical protein
MIVGIGLLLAIPAHLYVQFFGAPVTAIIDGRDSAMGRKRINYEYRYHYLLDGRRFDQTEGTGEETYNLTHVGDRFSGRATTLFGHTLFLSPERSIGIGILPLLGIALFWNSILSAFVYQVWVVPLRERWVAMMGVAVRGVVTGTSERTSTRRDKSTRYYIACSFTTVDGRGYSGKHQISAAEYQTIQKGDSVTVLYDLRRPSWNLPYGYCDLVVESPSAPNWSHHAS